MSESAATWSTTLHAILLHRFEPRALMVPGESGWSLPYASLDQELWSADVRKVNAALGEALAAPVTALRYVRFQTDDTARRTDAVYVLENHSPAWLPPDGARWIGRAELADLPLAQPDHRALIDRVLAETESGQIPDLREPWARPGWFATAAAWTESELLRLGYTVTAPVEQVKSWGISCILRGHTTGGAVYFKVASSRPLFVHEPRLTRRLSELYPGQVPAPLAMDDPRRWMLLADFGPAVGWDAPVEEQEEMLLAFGALQRDAAARIDDLWACGCLDRRLDRLAAQIDPLLADTAMFAVQSDAAEMATLHALVPRLKAMCAELASYAVPHTLVHGDLHLGNVARSADRYLFFDWTDACVAHPFFDTISIFQHDDPSHEERLRDSYLSLWLNYEPMGRLRQAWALAKPLAALHQAVSYQHIVNSLEPIRHSENFSGLPYWLRRVLGALKEE